MGVIHSLPLCSRGDKEDTNNCVNDNNNNQPMPSLQPQEHSVVVVQAQPLSASQLERQQTSIANQNVDIHSQPEATSTPKLDRTNGNDTDYSLESDPEGHVIYDEDEEEGTDDSGLEQSSSDELELGNLGGNNKKNIQNKHVTIQERPFSAAGRTIEEANAEEDEDGDGLDSVPLDDEGINETLDVTIPMENHETCEESDGEEDELEDPVERPPEPTVPDERVGTSSSESSDRQTPPRNNEEDTNKKQGDKNRFVVHRKTGAGDTTSAISNLLSEIVGTDKPYEEDVEHHLQHPGFANAIRHESATGR